MLDGDWQKAEMSDTYELRLGKVFTATIKQWGGDSIYAKCWIVTLNQDLLTETNDLEFAKGRVEWEIVTQLDALKDAYRRIKQRVPTSSDLFPHGAFYRWKVSRMVKPGRIDLSALKTDPEAWMTEHLFRGSTRDFVNELWDGYSFDWEATENHARREVEWATQRGS